MLLTNLLTDFPEMAIATDNVDSEWLQKPLRWNIHWIRKFMFVFALISSLFDYARFGVLLFFLKASESEFRTGWFVESVVSATFMVLVIRTFRPFFSSRPSRCLWMMVAAVIGFVLILPTLPFADILGFVALPFSFYLYITLILLLYIVSVE